MSDDIFEILRKQEQEIRKKNIYYFHYDPTTSKIINFRNYLDNKDSLPFLKLQEEHLEFSLDEFDITEYRVIEKNNKLCLAKPKIEETNLISNIVYQVPKIYSKTNKVTEYYDIIIEQDNKNKQFIIRASRKVKQDLIFFKMDYKIIKMFVTAPGDPNILYKTLIITGRDLFENDIFIIPFEEYTGNISNIFLMKYFQSYLHLDVRNE